jgi:hypothetical protein
LGGDGTDLEILTPAVKDPGVPIALMRTVNIDLSSTWVTGWLTRKLKKEKYVDKFKKIAMDDMQVTMEEIQQTHVDNYFENARTELIDFVSQHADTLKRLTTLDSAAQRHEILKGFGLEDEVRQRIIDLENIAVGLQTISAYDDAAPMLKVANG